MLPVVRHHVRILLTFAVLLAGLSTPWIVQAQGQSGVTITARAGFDGYYEINQWIPVHITLENNGPSLDGRVEVRVPRYGGEETVYAYPVSLPTVSRKEVVLYVYPESYLTSELDVTLIAGDANGSAVAQTIVHLNSIGNTDRLFGVLAGSPSVFNILAEVDPLSGTASVAQLEPGDLPDRAQAFDALDVLVISDIDTGILAPEQREALSGWVAGGGRLIVAGGPSWQKTVAGLRDLLPLLPESTRALPELTSLQTYATSPYDLTGGAVVATGALAQDAEVLMSQADVPLIVRRRVGFGEVTYITADLALAPLKGWDGAADLYRTLISSPVDRPGWAYGFQDWYSASDAASTLPNLNLPPTSLICGFLGLYIVAVGPLNYIFVRVMKRRELAWFSVPVLVIVFSGVAFFIGSRARGNQPILNRLAIVQVWPGDPSSFDSRSGGSGRAARANGVVGIFSPNRATYQLSIDRNLLAHPVPSDTPLGSDGGDWTFLNQSDRTTVPDLRMDVAGFTLLAVEGQVPAPALAYNLTLSLSSAGAAVQGSVTNNSGFVLRDAVVLGPGEAQRLGDLEPGDTRPLQLSLQISQRASQPGQVSAYYYGGDSTIDDILGVTNYYADAESRRRYGMLRAMINPYNAGGLGSGSRGGGIYLAGWTDESPLAATLDETEFGATDTTLYLVSLTPALAVEQGQLTIPPGLFTWSLEPGPLSDASPYGTYLNQNFYSLRFNLAQPIPFSSVESLTLHLTSSGATGPTGLIVRLWDFEIDDWAELPNVNWGDTDVPHPARHVGPGSEVRLVVDGTNNPNPIHVETSDITLVVKP